MALARWTALALATAASACSTGDACKVEGPAMETILEEIRAGRANRWTTKAAYAEIGLIEACEAIIWGVDPEG